VVMGNGPATLRLLLGAMYGGRCVTPVNLLSQPEQMRHVIGHCDARLVVCEPQWEARLREIAAGLPQAPRLLVVDPQAASIGDERAADGDARCEPADPQAIALLMYT